MTTLIKPLHLRLCDEQYRQTTPINLYSEITYTARFANRDSFEFTISRHAKHAEELRVGRILIVPNEETTNAKRVLIIKQIDVSEDFIICSGNDYLWELFSVRLALAGTTTGTGYDTQSGPAETLARHYIAANITEAENPLRRDDLVRLEPEHETPMGGICHIEARFQTIQEILESICTQGNIGIAGELVEDTTLDGGWYIEIRIQSGTDRSQE